MLDKSARRALAERYQMSVEGPGGAGGKKGGGSGHGTKMLGARGMTKAERDRQRSAAERAAVRYHNGEVVTRKGEKAVPVAKPAEDPKLKDFGSQGKPLKLASVSRKGKSGR